MESEVHNIDCLEYMQGLPDKAFALAIADPPYGIGATRMNLGIGLVAYRWPGCKPESTTTEAITPTTCRTVAGAYPFTTAHTDRL